MSGRAVQDEKLQKTIIVETRKGTTKKRFDGNGRLSVGFNASGSRLSLTPQDPPGVARGRFDLSFPGLESVRPPKLVEGAILGDWEKPADYFLLETSLYRGEYSVFFIDGESGRRLARLPLNHTGLISVSSPDSRWQFLWESVDEPLSLWDLTGINSQLTELGLGW